MARNRVPIVALVVLIAALATLLRWEFAAPPAPLAVAADASAGIPGAPAAREASNTVPAVRLEQLGRDVIDPIDTGRDPFRLATAMPAPSPGGRTGPAGRGGSQASTAALPAPVAAAPVVAAGPPPIPLKFIGVMTPRRGGPRVAMLADGRGVYSGSEGDIIEGRYRIVRIGPDSVDMTYLDGSGRRTIPLSGA